jgi:hypothetical protein
MRATWSATALGYSELCQQDCERIVAKYERGTYAVAPTSWIKILNPSYSQKHVRHPLVPPFAGSRRGPSHQSVPGHLRRRLRAHHRQAQAAPHVTRPASWFKVLNADSTPKRRREEMSDRFQNRVSPQPQRLNSI